MRNLLMPALLAGAALSGTVSAATKEISKEEMIANAESAAPAAAGKRATVITLDDQMQLVVSRKIGKHWICVFCGYEPGKSGQSATPRFDRAGLRLEWPIVGAGAGGADYTLTVILAYPDGRRLTLGPWGEGKRWDAKTCEREAERARLQLGETLSVARLVSAECTVLHFASEFRGRATGSS